MTNRELQERYRQKIEAALERVLTFPPLPQEEVFSAMRYSLTAGGKRLRPILTLAFCEACGGEVSHALPFAAAVDLIHCYSLIHDDLPCMDDDDLRRGKPSCHKKYGEAMALLAGDGLLTAAFHCISNAPRQYGTDPDAALRAVERLSHYAGVLGMIGGQVMDLAAENRTVDADWLRQMHEGKTSALIQAACELGVLAGGGDEHDLSAAADFGLHLGLAFQFIDDILDVTATEEQLGKPIGSDDRQHKTTCVTLYGLERARQLAAESTALALDALRHFGSPPFLCALTRQMLERDH